MGERVKVLHVISEMGVGGAEMLVAELVQRGRDHGWESAVASAGGVRADELAQVGTRLFRVPRARRSPLGVNRAVRVTRRAVRRFAPDVVLAHNPKATYVARAALRRRTHVPLVSVFHGVAGEDYPRAARILERRATMVVTVADVLAERLRSAGLRRTEPTVIPNCVPMAPHGDRAASRTVLSLDQHGPVVLCLARLVPQKRHDVLLAAWSQLDPSLGAVLLLAGDGPLRAQLERRAAQLGIASSVRFLGNRDDVPDLLAAADLTVLTSDWEGLPMAVLESLAAGRPVVATDVDGVREVLSGGGGVVVPAGDAAAVAAALRRMLADADARDTAATAGLATIRRHHDPATMAGRYAATVTAVRGDAPARRRPRRGRLTAALAVVAAGLVGVGTYGLVTATPVQYQARIGIVAAPTAPDPTRPASTAQYGEVVTLAMPAVNELVRTPTVLEAAAAAVSPAPSTADLANAISVEYAGESAVARITVLADTPQRANDLVVAVARGVERSDVLAPVARLATLDSRADVVQVGPDRLLAIGLALAAAAAAAIAVLVVRHLARPSLIRRARVADAVALAGSSRPVAVLHPSDPDLAARIAVLQRAAARPVRVVSLGPGLGREVAALRTRLADDGVLVAEPQEVDAVVVALLDRDHARTDELTTAVGALPDAAALVAVVVD